MQLDSLFSKTFKSLSIAATLAAFSLGAMPLAAHADQLADVKKAGELVVGTEMQFAPFDFLDAGKQKGLNAELFEELGKELGSRSSSSTCRGQACCQALRRRNSMWSRARSSSPKPVKSAITLSHRLPKPPWH